MTGPAKAAGGRAHLHRGRGGHDHARVTNVELFFDLVFVFAITQLSHLLLGDPTPRGAGQTALLFLAVWWVWIFTSWVTNWLDPERAPVRLLLLALMLAGLVLSSSIPTAFAAGGLGFASAYVFMQVGRSLFMLWALSGVDAANTRNFQRISAWLALAGAFWIAGAFAADGARVTLWAIALGIEYVAPAAGFHVPGLGRSTTRDWNVDGAHMAERCSLFMIIALGESIVVTGATFAGLAWTASAVAAFSVAFVGTAAMWWIYFDTGAERGSRRIGTSSDPGRLARLAYTYVHLPIVAGVVVAAVADELVLAHPLGHADAAVAATVLGGPALFVLGNLLFKRTMTGHAPLSHLVGLALLALLVPVSLSTAPLVLGVAVTLVLLVVAVWETISLRDGGTTAVGE